MHEECTVGTVNSGCTMMSASGVLSVCCTVLEAMYSGVQPCVRWDVQYTAVHCPRSNVQRCTAVCTLGCTMHRCALS